MKWRTIDLGLTDTNPSASLSDVGCVVSVESERMQTLMSRGMPRLRAICKEFDSMPADGSRVVLLRYPGQKSVRTRVSPSISFFSVKAHVVHSRKWTK